MKKYLLAAACTLLASTVSADPSQHDVTFSCPSTNLISNFGDYVAGYGTEMILGGSRPVYFKTNLWPAGVPSDLSTYASADVNYDSITAQVTCSYVSSDSNNGAFDLMYYVTNGKGGLITAKTVNVISLQLPVGLKK